jgi:hypothetical protein
MMPSTGSNRSLATSLLITAVVLQAAVSAEALDGIAPKERVLHFPPHRSLGVLMVQDAGTGSPTTDSHFWLNWEYLGNAVGNVTVPAGKRLCLSVDKVTVKTKQHHRRRAG